MSLLAAHANTRVDRADWLVDEEAIQKINHSQAGLIIELPEPLHDGFRNAITNLFNAHVDQDEIGEFEQSSVYLEMIIRGYKKQVAGTLAEGQWPEVVKMKKLITPLSREWSKLRTPKTRTRSS